MKPLCFLDVDGVINASPPLPEEERELLFEARGYKICFPLGLVENVKRLVAEFDMAWLTTWEDSANEHFVEYFVERLADGGHRWPAVEWREPGRDYPQTKLQGAKKWMEQTDNVGRPFAQIDDDSFWEQQELRAANIDIDVMFPQPKLLIVPRVDEGLQSSEVDEALEWARGLC